MPSSALIASSAAGLRAPAKAAPLSRRASVTAKAPVRPQQRRGDDSASSASRREVCFKGAALTAAAAAAPALTFAVTAPPAAADSLPEETDVKLLCSAACELALLDATLITTASGLQYKDVIVGDGAQPSPGFQVVVDYIAKNEKGLIFDNSLEKGKPNDIRVTGDPTSSLVIAGLDEGILTMKSGGLRRMYIPGELAFPKGLASAPGRPRIAPFSPVVFDVKLIYIPGLE
mmetsp:Transcript_14819/g.24256  ORF Transcript_14819/g.24256 Transcript_14819/m.24256 type:complete len:231 (-) Transcript_14819:538-1230(-)